MTGRGLDLLPDEILLQVFSHLGELCPYEEGPWYVQKLPYRTLETITEPHPGLRAYPFLGQVCQRWRSLLSTPIAKTMLWKSLVLSFGHEVVTSVHTPLAWSNRRPNNHEFMVAFGNTTLSAARMIDFVAARRNSITRLALVDSEGFFGEEHEYLSLVNKHNFTSGHLGMLLGLLQNNLEELRLSNCNDLLGGDPAHSHTHAFSQGVWSLASLLPQLKVLAVEALHMRVQGDTLAHLSRLTKLEKLSLTSEDSQAHWTYGVDRLPPALSRLTALRCLELRGHALLDTLPAWLATLPHLTHLDISSCTVINLVHLTKMSQLHTLVLQRLDLQQSPLLGEPISPDAKRFLPLLSHFSRLTALSLSHNHFTRMPDWISKLTTLSWLDMSYNPQLQVPAPLTGWHGLSSLQLVDLREVHRDSLSYWSEAKCVTMEHLANLAKALKRRQPTSKVLMDTN